MSAMASSRKAVAVNPLKTSAPLGAALAFLGLDRCLPLFHGSQGCTAFALVLMVRHFREAIPLQTTALNAVSTILGGADSLEQAIGNIHGRAKPRIIGICSTALTATRGEDMVGDLKLIRERHPEWGDLETVFVDAPDYTGSLQDGWSAAVTAILQELVPEAAAEPRPAPVPGQVNLLAGSHLTAGDVEELRDTIEAFGLTAIVLPDLSGSLDGHVPESYTPTTLGGSRVEDIRRMGASVLTLAIGEHMRAPAEALARRAGVPFRVLDRVTGLAASDALIEHLAEVSGRPVPKRCRRERSRLIDAMLDGHFHFGGARLAIAAEPDLLLGMAGLCADLGADVVAAVTTAQGPATARLPSVRVTVGDLDDLETAAGDCDLVIASSQAAPAAERLGVPLFRAGFPQTDRLGAAHRVSVGYRGTRNLVFELGNALIERRAGHGTDHGSRHHGGYGDDPGHDAAAAAG